jgi:hypothetical protein
LFRFIKIITPPAAGAANPDGSVSTDYLKSAGFRYMGYLAGQTVIHPDGTTDVIPRPLFGWVGDAWDDAKGAGEWVLGECGQGTLLFWPSATVSVHLRAFSNDPVFQGQPLITGWGDKAGQEIGLPGVRVNFWYFSLSLVSPYGGTTDAKGQLTANVPKFLPLLLAEIPVDNDAAKISWNGIATHTIIAHPEHLDGLTGDTSAEIKDATYLNALAQFSDGRDYLKTVVGYTPSKDKVAEGFAVNTYASGNGNNAVTTCATFPNLVFAGTSFASWMLDSVLATYFPPALLAVLPYQQAALNSDMWLPDSDKAVFYSRGIWTHEYGHYALCSMIASNGAAAALSSLTTLTMQTIFEAGTIGPNDETRILSEAFADFFAAQVAGGTNYYAPPASLLSNYINYCVESSCLEENKSATSTGSDVIARDITIFMDAFDGVDAVGGWTSLAPNAGDSWIKSSANPPTLAYASQKYADSCLAGRAADNSNNWSSCDEFVSLQGPDIFNWVTDWVAHSAYLDHSSFMTALARTARTIDAFTWCDLCRLFAVHTPGNQATPQDLGLSTPVPITQYSLACLSSPIKDWIGPPPDPSLTNLDSVFNQRPYVCEVCLPGSSPGPDRCVCGPHQIPDSSPSPNGPSPNCVQCAADKIAVHSGLYWECVICGPGVPIDGQNACQCNPGSTQGPDGTCVSACGPHAVWQGGQCVDCGPSTSYPDPTGTTCLSCPPSAPYCNPNENDSLCYGACQASCCAIGRADPEPGSMLCGGCSQACGCTF